VLAGGAFLLLAACSDSGSAAVEAVPTDAGCGDACPEDTTLDAQGEPDVTEPDAQVPDTPDPDAADTADADTRDSADAGPCDEGFWGPNCDQRCDCDDGLFCTGVETCDRTAGCVPGQAPEVDDGVACTRDRCDEDGDVVVHEAVHGECDDGLFCNGAEVCDLELGCVGGAEPLPVDDGDPCTIPTSCNEAEDRFDTVNNDLLPTCGFVHRAPVDRARDYGFWYWPGNHRPTETWPAVETTMHFLTGHYAFTFDEATGSLGRMGALDEASDAEAALGLPADDLDDLPSAELRFEAGHAGSHVQAVSFLGANNDTTNRARLTDAGRFMNHVEIPTVGYGDETYQGRLEIASMPRHVVFNHTVTSSGWSAQEDSAARIVLSGAVLAELVTIEWLEVGRALRLTDGDGNGWVFAVYGAPGLTTTLAFEDGQLSAERSGRVAPGTTLTASLLAAPTSALSAAELEMYLDPSSVTPAYTLLDRLGRPVRDWPVAWDPARGAYEVTLQGLRTAGAPRGYGYDVPGFHNWYGRHRLVVDTHGEEMAVPLYMSGGGNTSWYITGGAPLLRDAGGDPLGLHVQISKNWHDPPAWYHLYAHPTFGGDGPNELELTVASSRWGAGAYAASHAQLSLIGWGTGGGHWDESALGAFGESITYDPDVALGRSMVDDVRPVLVLAQQKWLWTGNVGGADFLRYRTEAEPYWIRRLSQVRSHYAANAPNLTDVVYAGVTTDGRIRAKIRTQLGRTDDLVRVYYHLEYTFLDDVTYDRLAFFQMSADRYGDNWFTRYAYGNAQGVTTDAAVPDHGTTGYAQDADRGIALSGQAPWVMLYASTQDAPPLPENLANVGFIVRDFRADIGGTVVTTPHINLHRTNNRSSQVAFELGLPYEDGSPWCGDPCQGQTRFVPAGSTVRATVEYVIPPADKSAYYGASDYLLGLPDAMFDGTEMMLLLAAGNDLAVDAAIGEVRRVQPVEIDAVQDAIAAEFTLTGGLGYTPVTFHNLNRHDGWWLAHQQGDDWVPLDQTVQGKDFWQARFEPGDTTWSLTFNIPNRGLQTYRLLWSPTQDLPAPPPVSLGPPDRPAQLLAPLEYDPRGTHPVVIWLHGHGETAVASAQRFAMTVEAQSQGFFVALPEGTTDAEDRRFWNATPACCDQFDSGVDDVAYLTTLVEELSGLPGVAPEQIFFMGHENGGFMSYRMACELSEAVAGVVVIRGTDFATDEACIPRQPVSVLHIAGTQDAFPLYTYDPDVHPEPYASAPDAVRRWAGRAGCNTDAPVEGEPLDLDTRVDGAETRVTRYEEGCAAGAELWTLEGGGGPVIDRSDPVPRFTLLTADWMRRQPR
jgi:poly(3-hydroxybutyrate) depolymerase